MPIPKNHLDKLDEMLRGHELILKVCRDQKVMAALNELAGDRELRLRVAKDPQAYVKEKNLHFPSSIRVHFEEHSPWKATLSIETSHSIITFGYDSGTGFFGKKKDK